MAGRREDPDRPEGAGVGGRLHMALGRLAISAAARLRPPISLGVRLLALNGQGEILLVRHSYLPGLALPGGGVEPGETCREAAIREATEETGLEFAAPPVLFHLYFNRRLENRDHVALFIARGVRQPHPPGPRPEILWTGFCAPDALPDDVTPATRKRISEVLGGAPPPDEW
jgi:ADP-ribose pyrophosphatase YjhB (NUDIX family)